MCAWLAAVCAVLIACGHLRLVFMCPAVHGCMDMLPSTSAERVLLEARSVVEMLSPSVLGSSGDGYGMGASHLQMRVESPQLLLWGLFPLYAPTGMGWWGGFLSAGLSS